MTGEQENHDSASANTKLALGLSLGMTLGIVFGLLLLDNLALGIALGSCTGLAFGGGFAAVRRKQEAPDDPDGGA